jgi:hypothetical protein
LLQVHADPDLDVVSGGVYGILAKPSSRSNLLQAFIYRPGVDGPAQASRSYSNIFSSPRLKNKISGTGAEELERWAGDALSTLGSWIGTGPIGSVLLVHSDDFTGASAAPFGAAVIGNGRGRTSAPISVSTLVYSLAELWIGVGVSFYGPHALEFQRGLATALALLYLKSASPAHYPAARHFIEEHARRRGLRGIFSPWLGFRPADTASLGVMLADRIGTGAALRGFIGTLVRDNWATAVHVDALRESAASLGLPRGL